MGTISLVTDHHGEAGKKEAAGDDENSRYALEDAEEDAGKKGLRGRGTKRNETPVNASGTVSHLDKKLPGSSCAANRRAETPLNVTGNPVFRLNAITELAFAFLLFLLFHLSLCLFF